VKIALIGGGAMGEAIIASVLKANVASASDIRVAELYGARRKQLEETYAVTATEQPQDAVDGAEYVMLAVKPQEFGKAAQMVSGRAKSATAVSIMAGVTINQIRHDLGMESVVRAMPNTPAQIGEGMTVWTATHSVTDAARDGARRILGALGKEAYVPEERYLDMATALSGSGPAYVFLFIEALIDAGVHVGLSRDLSTTMALQTVIGSARYAEETKRNVAELRNQVTSPGGTTVEALRALENGGFRAAVLEAVIAAFEKSKALGAAEPK
jgi:pyrroline-5-carboxylate reductase